VNRIAGGVESGVARAPTSAERRRHVADREQIAALGNGSPV